MFSLLAGLLSLFTGTTQPLTLQGYVEGEYVRVGSPLAGTLAELRVREGDSVAAGQPLFSLDTVTDRAARDQAAALLAQAEAQLADLKKGKRPDELKSIAEQKAQAEAAERLSAATLKRQEDLVKTGNAAQQALDQARSALDHDRAQIRQLAADYRVALLGARADEIEAQEALVAQDRAELAKADKRLVDDAPAAPAAAFVEKVFYRPGEVVAAGQPVVSLLPPANVKLVFFLPEPRLGALQVGQTVAYACDGCRAGATARISFVASQVEYTPPVIYSVGSRDKLVIRVEARPLDQPLALHPGQPVDVSVALPQ
jgi:HlyD family secretion protein